MNLKMKMKTKIEKNNSTSYISHLLHLCAFRARHASFTLTSMPTLTLTLTLTSGAVGSCGWRDEREKRGRTARGLLVVLVGGADVQRAVSSEDSGGGAGGGGVVIVVRDARD